MNYEVFHKISEMKPEIALTITMDTYPRSHSKSRQNAIVLKNILKEAESALLEQYSKREVGPILENLERLSGSVDPTEECHGIVMFISANFTEHYRLPFHPGNSIKVGNKFATRTIIRAIEHGEYYYLLALSQSEVRLFEAYSQSILGEVKDDSFPFTENRFYQTDSLKRSFGSSTDKSSQQFFRQAEEVLLSYYHKNPLPIVIAGTEEAFANYQTIEKKEKLVIGHIRGNYDDPTTEELKDLGEKAWGLVQDLQLWQQVQSIEAIMAAHVSNLLETELFDIYDYAKKGQVKELYVEESYFVSAALNSEGRLVGDLDAGLPVDDAVNEVIYEVLKYGGSVSFIDPYLLDGSKRIAAILRWRS